MESQDKVIESLTKTIEIMTNELSLLREQIEYLRQKLYGKSSEKVVYQPGQLSFLGRKFSLKKKLTYPVETETITYKRKKAKGVRQ
ncbi:hypothetical protein HO998_12180, partial [Streptococcus suis]|nr:hypothetical protein [Streptococcus suis]